MSLFSVRSSTGAWVVEEMFAYNNGLRSTHCREFHYIIVVHLFVGVPLHLFFLSVFFGLMPYNYICVTSGAILSELQDVSDIMTWTNIGLKYIHSLHTVLCVQEIVTHFI